MEGKDETRVHISSCVKRRCTVQTGGEAEGVETTHRCTMAAEVITGRLQQQHYSEAIIHTHTHTHHTPLRVCVRVCVCVCVCVCLSVCLYAELTPLGLNGMIERESVA